MLQVLFHLHLFGHDIPIYGYGLMLVLTFFACLATAHWLGRRNDIDTRLLTDAVMLALATGLVGARLSHVIENWSEFTRSDLSVWQNLVHVFDMRQGGLTFYGGFFLATPCCIAFARYHRIPILLGMDIVGPVLMVGLGVGRIGCFLNGCCYGELCDLPWGVQFPYYSNAYIDQFGQGQISPPPQLLRGRGGDSWMLISPESAEFQNDAKLQQIAAGARALPVQPAELYSSFTALLLAALLIAYMSVPHIHGRVFALMMMLEGFSRYILELIRVEPTVYTLHLAGNSYHFSTSMILGIQVFVAGVAMWIVLGNLSRADQTPSATPSLGVSTH